METEEFDEQEREACDREWESRVVSEIDVQVDYRMPPSKDDAEYEAGIKLIKELHAARAGTHKTALQAKESIDEMKASLAAVLAQKEALEKELAVARDLCSRVVDAVDNADSADFRFDDWRREIKKFLEAPHEAK